MKTFITLIALLLSYMVGYAQTTRVQVGDLYYNLSGATASVTTSDVIPVGRGPMYSSKYTKDVYVIPSHITYEGLEYEVVAIDKWAFAGFRADAYGYATVVNATGSTAHTIILPPTIKRIGESAFANCMNLTRMIIPANVESMYTGYNDYCSPFYNTPLLRELVYLSPDAPSGWHATSKTFVPNIEKYKSPTSSITDASVLPILSTNESSSVYSGEIPNLDFTSNLQNNTLDFDNPSLEKNVGKHNACIDATISNEYISYAVSLVVQYNILPKEVIVSTPNVSREYGDTNPEFIINYDGLVNNEGIEVFETAATAFTSARQTSNVGKYDINISGAKASNYTFVYTPGVLEITKAGIELTVNDAVKSYGMENPSFTLSFMGLKNDEIDPKWNQYPTFATEAGKDSDVGIYEVTASGGNVSNYEITKYNSGKLTINKAAQTIIWKQSLNGQIGAQIELSAVSSSGLPVSYKMTNNDVAKLINDNDRWYLDCIGSGFVNIQALQNGDKNYNAATMLNKSLIVVDPGSHPQITLEVKDPGTLSSLIADNRKYQIKNLRLTGNLNGTDIKLLRDMSGSDENGNETSGALETLDISACSIVSGGDYYYKSYYTYKDKISKYMFYNCKQLVNLFLPINSYVIEDFALANCEKLLLVSIPDAVQSFGNHSFEKNISLHGIPMPNSLTAIGDMAFMGCNNITELDIPANVRSIGDGIVKDCENISKINVDVNNQHFASKDGVLFDYNCTTLKIFPVNNPSSIYKVMNGVTRIAPYSFVNAKKLTEVTLPSSLLTIGTDAFIGCVNLNVLHVESITPPVCDNDCFENVSKTRCELQVPYGCYNAYWVAPVWSEFNHIKEVSSSGIGSVQGDNPQVTVENGVILLNGITGGGDVMVYLPNGILVWKEKSTGEPLQYRPDAPGLYIVVVGNIRQKILVK